jgi:hypothetical protein
MSFFSLWAVFSPIAIGFLIGVFLVPLLAKRFPGYFALVILAGLGYAFVSCTFFAWRVILSPGASINIYLCLEILIVLLLTAYHLAKTRTRRDKQTSRQSAKIQTVPIWGVLATVTLILCLVDFLENWQLISFQKPFGDWDAWAIWNLRAGFISSDLDWRRGFSPVIGWSHPDYPLLLPLNIARIWVLTQDQSVLVPIGVNAIFMFSLLGLLIAIINIHRGHLQSMLAGLLGIAILFESLTFKQYADMPIAYYYLAANILVFLDESTPNGNTPLAVFAGALTGAALWTKNEGWAFLASIIAARVIVALISRENPLKVLRRSGSFALGLLPLLITVVYFKLELAAPSDLFANLNVSTLLDKLLSVQRYLTIFRFAGGQFIRYGNLVLPLLPLLLIYLLIMGTSVPKEQAKSILSLSLRLALLAGSYFVVYLLTPHDLAWHLSTSINRLLSQIMPSLLFLYFLVVSPLSMNQGEIARSHA